MGRRTDYNKLARTRTTTVIPGYTPAEKTRGDEPGWGGALLLYPPNLVDNCHPWLGQECQLLEIQPGWGGDSRYTSPRPYYDDCHTWLPNSAGFGISQAGNQARLGRRSELFVLLIGRATTVTPGCPTEVSLKTKIFRAAAQTTSPPLGIPRGSGSRTGGASPNSIRQPL